jgi:hypothetical protein
VIRGRKVKKLPEFPSVWLDAHKKSRGKVLVQPDELFKQMWPD